MSRKNKKEFTKGKKNSKERKAYISKNRGKQEGKKKLIHTEIRIGQIKQRKGKKKEKRKQKRSEGLKF